jgi:hypothetical protein
MSSFAEISFGPQKRKKGTQWDQNFFFSQNGSISKDLEFDADFKNANLL